MPHTSVLLRKAARWRRKVAGAAITTVIVTVVVLVLQRVLNDAISGIIGNTAYASSSSLWSIIVKSIQTNAWPWYITALVTVIALVFFLQTLSLKGTVKVTDQIVSLDDELLRQLASAVAQPGLQKAVHRLLERLLCNVTEALPEDPYKASILLPDANREYLHICMNFQMSVESVQRTRFYIGGDENKKFERGTAGLTFLDQQVRLGHIVRNGHDWKWEAEGYIPFGEKNPYPSHQSFISLPIIGIDLASPKRKASCLGVVCFDSTLPDIFDSAQTQKVLQTLVRRIAVALIVQASLTQGGRVA